MSSVNSFIGLLINHIISLHSQCLPLNNYKYSIFRLIKRRIIFTIFQNKVKMRVNNEIVIVKIPKVVFDELDGEENASL